MKKTTQALIVIAQAIALGVWMYIHFTDTTIETRYLATLVVWCVASFKSLFQEFKK